MMLHRALGWSYQVELPARTVAHLPLGLAIGAILLIKIVIVRFFKHLESSMIPMLGTALLVATVLLIGLSAPVALREAYTTTAGQVFSEVNRERVRSHLMLAGLEDSGRLDQLAALTGLRAGREVLSSRCVECHDLRTVLARPRTPRAWRDTGFADGGACHAAGAHR